MPKFNLSKLMKLSDIQSLDGYEVETWTRVLDTNIILMRCNGGDDRFTFADQEVELDDEGMCKVHDTNNDEHELQLEIVLVMDPTYVAGRLALEARCVTAAAEAYAKAKKG